MRRSREAAAATRSRIVEVASRLFRAEGIDAVSIADVMGAAGLTIGGFYKHFESKDALVAEAILLASKETTEASAHARAQAPREAQAELMARIYLSPEHIAHPERGCPVAALVSEAAHQGKTVRKAFSEATKRLLDTALRTAPPGQRAEALRASAMLVGAVTLARTCGDRALGEEIVAAVQDDLVRRLRPQRMTPAV